MASPSRPLMHPPPSWLRQKQHYPHLQTHRIPNHPVPHHSQEMKYNSAPSPRPPKRWCWPRCWPSKGRAWSPPSWLRMRNVNIQLNGSRLTRAMTRIPPKVGTTIHFLSSRLWNGWIVFCGDYAIHFKNYINLFYVLLLCLWSYVVVLCVVFLMCCLYLCLFGCIWLLSELFNI